MPVLSFFFVACAAVAAVAYALAVWSTIRHTSMSALTPRRSALPSVSLLKPLKGLEEGLRDNLRSVYTQAYPGAFEVVVATTDPTDPALNVAHEVAREFPTVPTRFVRSDPGFGRNPKVANLAGALAVSRHDLVLQTDANVRLQPDYLVRVVHELEDRGAHLLSSMVVGQGEQSLGAALHNVHLSGFTAPATCFALQAAGTVVVIGKSMLFRKRDLAEVGGLELVRDILAEDFVLGRAFQAKGKQAVLSSMPVENLNVNATVDSFLERQARWLKMRAVIHVPAFVMDLMANPLGLLAAAFLASGLQPQYALLWLVMALFKAPVDAFLVYRTRGVPLAWRHAYVPALRDVLVAALWPYCAVSRTVRWRGMRARIGLDSRIEPSDTGPSAPDSRPERRPAPAP